MNMGAKGSRTLLPMRGVRCHCGSAAASEAALKLYRTRNKSVVSGTVIIAFWLYAVTDLCTWLGRRFVCRAAVRHGALFFL